MRANAGRRRASAGAWLTGLLGAVALATPGSALADAATITSVSQTAPQVGETVTFQANAAYTSGSCPGDWTFVWSIDGTPVATDDVAAGADSFQHAFTTTGDPVVSVSAHEADCPALTDQTTVHVRTALGGSISASSQSPGIGQATTLTANVTGGYAPLSYAWDTTNSGTFTPGEASIPVSFSTTGSHTVKVLVTDAASVPHQQVLTLNVTVTDCRAQLDFGLAEVTTGGCLAPVGGSSPQAYTTGDPIKVNGIPFPAPPSGSHFTITLPGPTAAGGEIALGSTEISLDGVTLFRGAVDWKLPAGTQGDDKQVAQLSVPAGVKVKGLDVGGSIAVHLGWAASGSHYATFPMNIALPNVFKSGPDQTSGGVTATGSVRVDDAGVHYDGLRLQVQNVWVGKLRVEQVCFSFVPGGGQAVQPCPAPTLDGQPFLTCSDNVNTDRWDGNAVITLPTSSHPRLAMFGGVAAGKVSKLGGFVDHLGTSVPIAEGVYLTRVGVGLCLYPPPFKLRGDVGVTALPVGGTNAVTINGSFLYTDAFGSDPWSLTLSGSMSVFDRALGDGSLTIRPTGFINFGLHASFNLYAIVSLDGSVLGWLDPPLHSFNLAGRVRGCIKSVCASSDAVVSSVGTAGCLDLGTITYAVLVKNHNWHWYTPWRVHWETRHKHIEAGFGYRWHASSVSLFGGSCDMGRFSAILPFRAGDAAGAKTVRVAPHTGALALRIKGSGHPFRVVVVDPHGRHIASRADGGTVSSPGHSLVVGNESDGSIDALLISPIAGVWHVQANAGSTLTAVQTAPFVAPPAFQGAVVSAHGGKRRVSLAYTLAPGESLALVERGTRSEHTIAARVRGHRCPGPTRQGGERLFCASVVFVPAFGSAGRRTILAVVTRDGVPVQTVAVASFTTPAPAVPKRPSHLQLMRRSGGVELAWARVAGAASYTTSITLSDGRKLGRIVSARCRGVLFRSVPSSVTASVEVAALRPDLVSGPFAALRLRSNASRSGASGSVPAPIC